MVYVQQQMTSSATFIDKITGEIQRRNDHIQVYINIMEGK